MTQDLFKSQLLLLASNQGTVVASSQTSSRKQRSFTNPENFPRNYQSFPPQPITKQSSSPTITISEISMKPLTPKTNAKTTLQKMDNIPSKRNHLNAYPHALFHDSTSDSEQAESSPFKIHRKLLRRRHVRKEQIRKKRLREEERAKQQAEREKSEQKTSTSETLDELNTENVDSSPSAMMLSPDRKLIFPAHGYGSQGSLVALHSDSPNSVSAPIFSPLRPKKRRNTRHIA